MLVTVKIVENFHVAHLKLTSLPVETLIILNFLGFWVRTSSLKIRPLLQDYLQDITRPFTKEDNEVSKDAVIPVGKTSSLQKSNFNPETKKIYGSTSPKTHTYIHHIHHPIHTTIKVYYRL